MGKSSGGVRNTRPKTTDPEVAWRVNQTQIDYDKMTESQRQAAISALKKQYLQRKKAIEIFGNDKAENVLLKATELFFKRNKIKL